MANRIITDQFLITCIHYEWFKTSKEERKAFMNICDLMVSDKIRWEIEVTNPSEAMELDEPMEAPGTVPNLRLSRLQEDSSDTSPSTTSRSTGSEESTSSPVRKRAAMENVPETIRLPRLADLFRLPQIDDFSTSEEDNELVKLLKRGGTESSDTYINTVPIETIRQIFAYFYLEETPSFVNRKVEKLCNVKKGAVTFIWHHLDEDNGLRRFTEEMTVIGDINKFEIQLSDANGRLKQRIQFWADDKKGCYIWNENQMKYVDDISYEFLAANEFIETVILLDELILKQITFETAPTTKWNQKEAYDSMFYQLIRRFMTFQNRRIRTEKFFMMIISQFQPHEQPFHLELLSKKFIQEIKFRMFSNGVRRVILTEMDYLGTMLDSRQWEIAKSLDIEDDQLVWLLNKFHTFTTIKMAKLRKIPDMITIVKDFQKFPFQECTMTFRQALDVQGLEECFNRIAENRREDGAYIFRSSMKNTSVIVKIEQHCVRIEDSLPKIDRLGLKKDVDSLQW